MYRFESGWGVQQQCLLTGEAENPVVSQSTVLDEQGMEASICKSSIFIGRPEQLTSQKGSSHSSSRVDGLTSWERRQIGKTNSFPRKLLLPVQLLGDTPRSWGGSAFLS